jgi:hypothetical protein
MIRQNHNTFDIYEMFSHNMAEGFSQSLDVFRNGQDRLSVMSNQREKISGTHLLGMTALHSIFGY